MVAAGSVEARTGGVEDKGCEAVVAAAKGLVGWRETGCGQWLGWEAAAVTPARGVSRSEVPKLDVRGRGGGSKEEVGAGGWKEGQRRYRDFAARMMVVLWPLCAG